MTATNRRFQVLVDMTRTVQSRGRMVGAVRVESEFASALLAGHPDEVVPVSWSAADERFVELDRGLACQYLSATSAGDDDVTGPALEDSRPGDPSRRRILLVTGAGWLSNIKLLHGMLRVRQTLGAELHVVVHDLMHVVSPHWAPSEEAQRCRSAFEAVLASADRVLVYSDSTARDMARLTDRCRLQIGDIGKMMLGTAFVGGHDVAPEAGDCADLADRPFVLYVSSIAARKNHAFIAQVWARLAAELGTQLPRLVFVGRVAADQEAMMERLGRDPALTNHVVHISAATDPQLAWLYSRCLFTVFPSLYEGWGLPVAESLALGKVCLASNASSIPEVAAGVTQLLDPLDIRAWCDAVRTLVLEPGARHAAETRVREGFRPITWSHATERLWQAIVPPIAAVREGHGLSVVRSLAQPISALITAYEPSIPVRTGTGRVVGYQSRVGISLADVPPHGLRLGLVIRNPSSSRLRVETQINGLVFDGCVLESGETSDRSFDLPGEVLLARGVLDISAVCRTLSGPALDGSSMIFEAVRAVALTPDQEAAAIEARRRAWRLGDTCHFTANSRWLPMLTRGWDEPARWGVWSVQPRAEISFRPTPQPHEPLVFQATVRGFVPPAQPELAVDVLLGGARLTTWLFQHPTDFSFVERVVEIPPDRLADGVVHLEFSIPQCRSPRELGTSQDERRLGLGLVKARCTTRSLSEEAQR